MLAGAFSRKAEIAGVRRISETSPRCRSTIVPDAGDFAIDSRSTVSNKRPRAPNSWLFVEDEADASGEDSEVEVAAEEAGNIEGVVSDERLTDEEGNSED